MKIEMRLTRSIIPYARNARKIPQQAIDKVAASIQEFGWRQPIVLDKEGVIIVGHTRWLAAQKLGLEQVPVHVAENLTPAQVRAYRLLDNRSHEETSWDHDLLGLELFDLKGMGIDLDLTGFDMCEIDDLLSGIDIQVGLTDVDAVPDIPETATSRLGDTWICDKHRVRCGDATKKDDVNQALEGRKADMVFCDPPYSVSYTGKTARKLTIKNDDLGAGFFDFLRDACANMLAVTKGSVYICMSSSELHTLFRAFTEAGGHWSTFIIWAKNHFTLGRSDYQRQYEPILYGWAAETPHYWCGARDQGDVWSIDRPSVNDLHPTMKPVELIQRAVRNSSKPVRNPKYLAWIRTLSCVVCGVSRGIEASHTGPHGLGQKSPDSSAIPLCGKHHRTGNDSYHKLGPRKFSQVHGLDIPEIVRKLNRKPIIRVEAGMFVGYIEEEQYLLGNIGNGIMPAIQKMIRLRIEHS